MSGLPTWGITPQLLAEPSSVERSPLFVEVRPDAPRHLIECYGGISAPRTRCAAVEEFGFEHPAITRLTTSLFSVAHVSDALFAGSIVEVVPTTEETTPGVRIAVAVMTDCYRFNDVDLRHLPFVERRVICEEIVEAIGSPLIRLAPLLSAKLLESTPPNLSTTTKLRLIPR